MELEQFRLYLEWIPGSRNLLADSLSCLLDVVPDAEKSKEPDDQEFSSHCFEELEPVKVMETISKEVQWTAAKIQNVRKNCEGHGKSKE